MKKVGIIHDHTFYLINYLYRHSNAFDEIICHRHFICHADMWQPVWTDFQSDGRPDKKNFRQYQMGGIKKDRFFSAY